MLFKQNTAHPVPCSPPHTRQRLFTLLESSQGIPELKQKLKLLLRRSLNRQGEARKEEECDTKLTTWGRTAMLMTSTRRRTMAQIIISKETSQERGVSSAQLDAARKTFIMRVAVFIIFLPPPSSSPWAAVASQTTNLHLKQEKERTKERGHCASGSGRSRRRRRGE